MTGPAAPTATVGRGDATTAPAVALRGVSFAYDGLAVLEDVDLVIPAGDFLGLVGPNGGGKSTLLKLILGLLAPDTGTVRVLGVPPSRRRVDIGYVPQFASFNRAFPISVADTVLMGRLGRTAPLFGYRRRDREIAEQAMVDMEVADLRRRPIGALSGGQLQRVLLARALASEPRILLLDEPTANVDPRVEKTVFDLLDDLRGRLTIVVVSHDIGFISEHVEVVACLNRRLVCHQATALTGEIIERLYGTPVHRIRHDTRVDLGGGGQ